MMSEIDLVTYIALHNYATGIVLFRGGGTG